MAHPFHDKRQSKVEHARVASHTKAYATGGVVTPAPQMLKPKTTILKAEGGPVKARLDRPGRASGGRVPKSTTVNVIVAPSTPAGAAAGAAPPLPTPPAAPKPPMGAAPPTPPGMPMGGPPPGMPLRARGGAVKKSPPLPPDPATTTVVGKGPATKASRTVKHIPGKDDKDGLNRGKPITYATGGKVEAPRTVDAPHTKGGAGGGLSRIDKQHNPKKYSK